MSEGGSGPAWGRVYQHIMRDPALSLEAKGLYAYFASFADDRGRCFPPVDTIRQEIPLSNATYYKYVRELHDAGILNVEKVRTGNRYESNIYHLLIPQQSNNCTVQKLNDEPQKNELHAQKNELYPKSKKCTAKQIKSTSHNKQTINRERKIQKESDPDRAAAVETICTILNSRRWRHSLKPQGGMRSLHKPDSFSWAGMIEAAEDCVAQYPRPTVKRQNELIGWETLNCYIRLLVADDTTDFPQKYEKQFYNKRPEM